VEQAHLMLLVIMYHETFNIQKVKYFTECCVQCNGVKYLRSSVHRAATAGFGYFGINDIILKKQRKTKSISLFPNNVHGGIKPR